MMEHFEGAYRRLLMGYYVGILWCILEPTGYYVETLHSILVSISDSLQGIMLEPSESIFAPMNDSIWHIMLESSRVSLHLWVAPYKVLPTKSVEVQIAWKSQVAQKEETKNMAYSPVSKH